MKFFESMLHIYEIISKLMVKSWCMKNYDFSVPKDVLRLLKHVSSNLIYLTLRNQTVDLKK